jgi:enoyl-CoA hydratase/carnithine racemase
MYENLLYQTANSITTITVNRPSVRNALNSATMRELKSAFEQANADTATRVIIFTGSGDTAFVAGADINELAKLSPVEGRDYSLAGQAIFDFIERLGKPVIAAVNGYALGGGCELAMACTFRIASDNAIFGQPEVKLGIIPGYGGTQRLSQLVGRGQASQLLITGEMIPATEALRIGLVNQVVPQAELIPTVEGIAKKVISNAPLAVKFCLDALGRGMQMEATLFGLSCTTEDMKEGTKAFLGKRAAEFKGK